MAQSGYTPISLYSSTTPAAVPTSGNLTTGELAINTADGKLFYKDSSGVVQTIASKSTGTVAGATTQVIYNNAGAYAGSSNFVFDGTNVGIGRTPDQRLQIAAPSAVEFDMFVGTTRTLSFYVDATQSIIAAPTAIPMIFKTNDTEQARISSNGFFQFNSGYGSVVPAYGTRVWVNFNGTGTVAVRGSGNVSSIGDNGTGDYTINFSTAMPDTNYAPVSGLTSDGSATTLNPRVAELVNTSTSAMRMICMDTTGGSASDCLGVYVSITR